MTDPFDIKAELDTIESQFHVAAPFDASPRGIRFRPDADLARRIEAVASRGDAAVAAVAGRLQTEANALDALVWLYILKQIPSSAAEAAIAAYVTHIRQHGLWEGQFPGRLEILLFLGWPADQEGEGRSERSS
jgi:hypothetical protein